MVVLNSALLGVDTEGGNSIFFPAVGTRAYQNGQVGGENNHGYYWSSTPTPPSPSPSPVFSNSYIISISIGYGEFRVPDNDANSSRASAHSIRCVVE